MCIAEQVRNKKERGQTNCTDANSVAIASDIVSSADGRCMHIDFNLYCKTNLRQVELGTTAAKQGKEKSDYFQSSKQHYLDEWLAIRIDHQHDELELAVVQKYAIEFHDLHRVPWICQAVGNVTDMVCPPSDL